MHIININSPIILTHSCVSFIEEIIASGDENYLVPTNSFYWLSKKVPIFLVDTDKYNSFIDSKNKNESSLTHPNWLSFYTRLSGECFENTPAVVMCPEMILNDSLEDGQTLFRYAYSLIYALVKAKIDSNNYDNLQFSSNDTLFHAMDDIITYNYMFRIFRSYAQCVDLPMYDESTYKNCDKRFYNYPNRGSCFSRNSEDILTLISNQLSLYEHHALIYNMIQDGSFDFRWTWSSIKQSWNQVKESDKESLKEAILNSDAAQMKNILISLNSNITR